jgi:Ca2+-binding RTX toxin-like protein
MKSRLSVLLALAGMLVTMLVLGGAALAATIDCVAGQQWCSGTPENDTINGTATTDFIEGLEGDDLIYGYGANDEVSGQEGNDRMHGGSGDDSLAGSYGHDTFYGGRGADDLRGGYTGNVHSTVVPARTYCSATMTGTATSRQG